jgi:DNA-binding response OmpR family regulator
MVRRHEVLVVEADERSRGLIRAALAKEGVRLTETATGAEARAVVGRRPIDVALVALGLPDVPGLDLVAELRALGDELHVVIVSSAASEADRLRGFSAGADDYITKPFSSLELAARVRVGLRHRRDVGDGLLRFGELKVDVGARRVAVGSTEVDLPRLEFDLLAHLALHPGRTFSREYLLRTIWGSSSEFQQTATVTEHVGRLRQKLECAGDGDGWITTMRGVGYRFDAHDVDRGGAPRQRRGHRD